MWMSSGTLMWTDSPSGIKLADTQWQGNAPWSSRWFWFFVAPWGIMCSWTWTHFCRCMSQFSVRADLCRGLRDDAPALQVALQLAEQISSFPQQCLRADRASAMYSCYDAPSFTQVHRYHSFWWHQALSNLFVQQGCKVQVSYHQLQCRVFQQSFRFCSSAFQCSLPKEKFAKKNVCKIFEFGRIVHLSTVTTDYLSILHHVTKLSLQKSYFLIEKI